MRERMIIMASLLLRSVHARRRGRRMNSYATARAVLHPAGELSACRVDVIAARFADRGHEARIDQRLLEGEDPGTRTGCKRRAGKRIPWNEIELARNVPDERGHFMCMLERVIDTV